MALIEGHVEALRGSVERAIFTGRNMVPSIFDVSWNCVFKMFVFSLHREQKRERGENKKKGEFPWKKKTKTFL